MEKPEVKQFNGEVDLESLYNFCGAEVEEQKNYVQKNVVIMRLIEMHSELQDKIDELEKKLEDLESELEEAKRNTDGVSEYQVGEDI